MRNDPTFDEMRDRLARIDEAACNGGWQDSDCAWCRDILEAVRGSVYCPECAHINAIGHNCDDWDCEHGTLHEEREAKVPRQYCKFVGAAKDAGPDPREVIANALADDENLWRDIDIAYTYEDRATNIVSALSAAGLTICGEQVGYIADDGVFSCYGGAIAPWHGGIRPVFVLSDPHQEPQ